MHKECLPILGDSLNLSQAPLKVKPVHPKPRVFTVATSGHQSLKFIYLIEGVVVCQLLDGSFVRSPTITADMVQDIVDRGVWAEHFDVEIPSFQIPGPFPKTSNPSVLKG